MNTRLVIVLVFLTASVALAAKFPIANGYLQGDLDAGGKSITNAAGLVVDSVTLGGVQRTTWPTVALPGGGGGTVNASNLVVTELPVGTVDAFLGVSNAVVMIGTNLNGSLGIKSNLFVLGDAQATRFIGDGSGLTGLQGVSYNVVSSVSKVPAFFTNSLTYGVSNHIGYFSNYAGATYELVSLSGAGGIPPIPDVVIYASTNLVDFDIGEQVVPCHVVVTGTPGMYVMSNLTVYTYSGVGLLGNTNDFRGQTTMVGSWTDTNPEAANRGYVNAAAAGATAGWANYPAGNVIVANGQEIRLNQAWSLLTDANTNFGVCSLNYLGQPALSFQKERTFAQAAGISNRSGTITIWVKTNGVNNSPQVEWTRDLSAPLWRSITNATTTYPTVVGSNYVLTLPQPDPVQAFFRVRSAGVLEAKLAGNLTVTGTLNVTNAGGTENTAVIGGFTFNGDSMQNDSGIIVVNQIDGGAGILNLNTESPTATVIGSQESTVTVGGVFNFSGGNLTGGAEISAVSVTADVGTFDLLSGNGSGITNVQATNIAGAFSELTATNAVFRSNSISMNNALTVDGNIVGPLITNRADGTVHAVTIRCSQSAITNVGSYWDMYTGGGLFAARINSTISSFASVGIGNIPSSPRYTLEQSAVGVKVAPGTGAGGGITATTNLWIRDLICTNIIAAMPTNTAPATPGTVYRWITITNQGERVFIPCYQ